MTVIKFLWELPKDQSQSALANMQAKSICFLAPMATVRLVYISVHASTYLKRRLKSMKEGIEGN